MGTNFKGLIKDAVTRQGRFWELRQPIAYERPVTRLFTNPYIPFIRSVNNIYVLWIEDVTFSANEKQCAGSVILLFPFKEICNWNSYFTDESSWGICYIVFSVWSLVLMFWIQSFWYGPQGLAWSTKNICRHKTGSICGNRSMSNA